MYMHIDVCFFTSAESIYSEILLKILSGLERHLHGSQTPVFIS